MKTCIHICVLLLANTFLQAQIPVNTSGKICVSGNCENGKGRVRLVNFKNFEYEGRFENGDLVGEGKIYNPDGSLMYSGTILHFQPNGEGTKFEQNSQKEDYIAEEGEFENGFLKKGSKFIYTGSIVSSGVYEPDSTMRLKSGFRSLSYRGKISYAFCDDFNRTKWNGKVTVREGDAKKGRIVSEAYYINGKREGKAKEWDYENNLYHEVTFKNSLLPASGVEGGKIYRIGDDSLIAKDVRYKEDAEEYLIQQMQHGIFHFKEAYTEINANYGKWWQLVKFKEMYDGGPIVINALANTRFGQLRQNDYLEESGISIGEVKKMEADVESFLKRILVQYNAAFDIIKHTSKSTYTQNRSKVENMRSDMLTSLREYLNKNKNKMLSQTRYDLETAIKKIESDLIFPAYRF